MAADGGVRVLIDISPVTALAERRTGLARVALSLSESLQNRSDVSVRTCAWGSLRASIEFEEVSRQFPELRGVRPLRNRWARFCADKVDRAGCGTGVRARLWRLAGQVTNRLRNPLAGVRLEEFDLVHSTYARFPWVIRRSGLPTVITVHDIMPLRLPADRFPAGQAGVTRRIIEGIRPSDWVACVSEWTRQDFLEISRHPPDRTVVISNGVDHTSFFPTTDQQEIREVREHFRLGDAPFLLTLSSLAAHKNLGFLCSAWSRVTARYPDARLVIAGGRTTDPNELCAALQLPAAPRGVAVTGHVTDADFRRLASSCQAFLFPSLYEGFGLPVLEAMACGAPVVASQATSLPEVVGAAGLLLPPDDLEAWIAAIEAAVNRPVRFERHRESCERAKRFSWSKTAEGYATLFKAVIS